MKKTIKRFAALSLSAVTAMALFLGGLGSSSDTYAKSNDEEEEVITLRVCNWEEYIDLGDWDEEEELIELESGAEILGVNPMYEDFEEWYYETYGKRVKVEYSCFGTNEDLYNMLTIGDEYDLVCPSDYMIMKLMAEDWLVPFSEAFFDETDDNNYYTNGVSPYIKEQFDSNEINGEAWSKYAAGYMWGVTGILYNPDKMTAEDASSWNVLNDPKYKRQVTIKDNVRDSYFSTLGGLRRDLFLSEDFLNDPNYHENLAAAMNDVSPETIQEVQDELQSIRENVYSFETDSGKADMVSGKVVANYQWSGDAVYAMDQAEEDDFYLEFAVPEECTNLWFDGWVMLKDGINGSSAKQHAAEAFVNYLSMPENAVRNMYYIGYTSCIAGTYYDDTVYEYVNWCYGYEDEEEDEEEASETDAEEASVDSEEETSDEETTDDVDEEESEELEEDDEIAYYPVGYFFTGDNEDEDYMVETYADQVTRQLFAQYPSQDVINRSAIMQYFDADANKNINQMWINVRCYNIKNVSPVIWAIVGLIILGIIGIVVYKKLNKYY